MWNIVTSDDEQCELAKLRETLIEELRKGFASWIQEDRPGAETTFRDLAETFGILSNAVLVFAEPDHADRN